MEIHHPTTQMFKVRKNSSIWLSMIFKRHETFIKIYLIFNSNTIKYTKNIVDFYLVIIYLPLKTCIFVVNRYHSTELECKLEHYSNIITLADNTFKKKKIM